MIAPKRVLFFLVHLETGQRYPFLNEDVVIGRTSGDILFANDMKLSHQHCRVVATPQGLGIHDLGSANGTFVDGKRLDPEKVYGFKLGATLRAGEQELQLIDSGSRKRPALRTPRRRSREGLANDHIWQVFAFALASLAIYYASPSFFNGFRHPASLATRDLQTPYEMVDQDMKEVVAKYRSIGEQVQRGQLANQKLVQVLRQDLLPNFKLVAAKLDAIIPQGEFQKRSLDLNKQICLAAIDQIQAMAKNTMSPNAQTSGELKKFSQRLETLSQKSQALKRSAPR